MIYFKWVFLLLIDLILLVFTVLPVAIVLSMFTKPMPNNHDAKYTWGWIWGTYDNPPQGDEGYVRKESPFPTYTTGFKGYVNRVNWIIRNNLYGYAKMVGLNYKENTIVTVEGNREISDKYKIPGSYVAKAYQGGKLVGFEYYCVKPWKLFPNNDFRCRLGWKIDTSKFQSFGFAPFVCTANPFDGYGDK